MNDIISILSAMNMSLTLTAYREACRINPTEDNLRILNAYEKTILDWIKSQLPGENNE